MVLARYAVSGGTFGGGIAGPVRRRPNFRERAKLCHTCFNTGLARASPAATANSIATCL